MNSGNELTDVDYGPLAGLFGTWRGDKGRDVSPEPDGKEENPYYETIVFEPIGSVTNAESQELAVLRYQLIVHRTTDHKAIHNETGYWMWDAASQTVIHSLAIPRAVCVLAGGKAITSDRTTALEVAARIDDQSWGILQSPFMKGQARTVAFEQKVKLTGDFLSYTQTTTVDIYGKTFEHTDENQLEHE